MGDCQYCHTKAGLFKKAHEACAKDAEEARTKLRQYIKEAINSGRGAKESVPEIDVIKQTGRLSEEEARLVLLKSADEVAFEIALKIPLSNEEADRISDLFTAIDDQCFKDVSKLCSMPGLVSLSHSNIIYQVLHGQVPHYDPGGFQDFRFNKGEHPIVRRLATLGEYRSVASGGNYQSVSIPVGAGVYYRVGTSQPRTQQTGLVPVDNGTLVITTQAIYFSSHITTFRIPYESIVRLESFVDGFGVYENYGSGKVFIPALLGTSDEGWYFYNLVSALSAW